MNLVSGMETVWWGFPVVIIASIVVTGIFMVCSAGKLGFRASKAKFLSDLLGVYAFIVQICNSHTRVWATTYITHVRSYPIYYGRN